MAPNPNCEELSNDELLQAQSHVWNHMYNIVNAMSLKCAVELGMFDVIHEHGDPMPLDDLISALRINESKSKHVHRLVRVLVHSEFLTTMVKSHLKEQEEEEEEEEEGYCLSLTQHSILLLSNHALSMKPYLLYGLDPYKLDPLHHLSGWFRSDDPTPFFAAHGMGFWEHARSREAKNHLFNEGMASDSRMVARVVTRDCKKIFEGLKSMVDVGGGKGVMAKALVDSFQGLKCYVLELPQVVDGLEGDEKLIYVSGSMFEFIPKAEAVLLKWILHDWDDEDCIRILKKCKEALISHEDDNDSKGKVIIIDMVLDGDARKDHKAKETQLLYDMTMMNLFLGKERTEKEWAKLFFDAGFASYKISHVLGLRSIIEVFP